MSQGVVHEDLRLLLETYLPSKKKKVLLGVGDPKIGAAIQEELGYNCQTGGVIAEVLRGEITLLILYKIFICRSVCMYYACPVGAIPIEASRGD